MGVVAKAILEASRSRVGRIGEPISHPPTQAERCCDDVMTLAQFQRDEEICCQGAPVEACFSLVSGAARQCVLRSDGRRQIIDLLLPGDLFGFALEKSHVASAEAVEERTMVGVYPKRRLERLRDSSPTIAREMCEASSAEQARQRAQCLILGRVTAPGKLGAFLMHMQERLGRDSCGATVLPFSRYEIADYLAISVETVCRALTDLRRRGYIRLRSPRAYQVIDPGALEGTVLH